MSDDTEKRAASLLHLRGDRLSPGDPVAPGITLSTMYHLPGSPEGLATYGRTHNASWEALEGALGHLEDASVLAFPSGMGAISAAFFACAKAGDRALLPSDGYYNTRLLAERFLTGLGVQVDFRPTDGFMDGGFEDYRLVFVETPSNPGLDLCDIAEVSKEVHAAGGLVVVDNTTMTPLGQRPLELGADIVVAADTKAPNGHSDVLMGHVATRNAEIFQRLKDWRWLSGAIPGPFEAWAALRGLETLEVRFDRMCTSAEVIAVRLAGHPAVSKVRFPGLTGDSAHALAKRQMLRFGFLIGLWLKDAETADGFINDCRFLQPATSFGGVHSSSERRARWGDQVAPGFVRLSVGCEPVEELWAAIRESLDRLPG